MSIWQRERVPGITGRHALGLWLTHRKVASAAYVPGEVSRAPLKFLTPGWDVVNFNLAARLNGEDRIVTPRNYWLTYLLGSSTLAAGFVVQLYDSATKQRLGDPVNFANALGSAQRPFILRKPYHFEKPSPILIRVQNLDTGGVSNRIQVVLMGYGE